MIISEIDISQKDVAMTNSADIQNAGTAAPANDPEQIADTAIAEKSPLNIQASVILKPIEDLSEHKQKIFKHQTVAADA